MHQRPFRKFDVSPACPFRVEIDFQNASTPISSDPPVSDGGNHVTVPRLRPEFTVPHPITNPHAFPIEIPAQMRALKMVPEFNPGSVRMFRETAAYRSHHARTFVGIDGHSASVLHHQTSCLFGNA
jgi:hypothetical protein